MKKIFIILLGLGLFCNKVLAQNPIDLQEQRALTQMSIELSNREDAAAEEVKGSRFFLKNFERGWVLKSLDTINEVNINYDLYRNQLLWKNGEGKTFIINSPAIKAFGFKKDTVYHVFVNKLLYKLNEDGFVEVIYQGTNCAILIDHQVRMNIKSPQAYGETIETKEYNPVEDVYFKINESIQLIGNKRDLNDLLKKININLEYKFKTRDFKNNLKLKNLGELIDSKVSNR